MFNPTVAPSCPVRP